MGNLILLILLISVWGTFIYAVTTYIPTQIEKDQPPDDF